MSSLLWVAFIFWLTPDGDAHSSLSSHVYRTYDACIKQVRIGVEERHEEKVWGDCKPLPGHTT